MFKPTEEELAKAARLGIEGADKMTGPGLRMAIQTAERILRAKSKAREEYEKWVAMCVAMGAQVPTGRAAPTIDALKRLYAARLPQALAERGIVEDATIRIPEGSGLTRSGLARVGKVWPMTSRDDRVTITLRFEGMRAFAHDAWLVWCHAIVVRTPRGN